MFRKIVDVLKEVFWIKPSKKKQKPARRKKATKAVAKKSPVKKKITKKSNPSLPNSRLRTAQAAKGDQSGQNEDSSRTIDPSLEQVGTNYALF